MGEIRFVGTGKTQGYPYLVCKKAHYEPYHLDLGFNYYMCITKLIGNPGANR